MKKITILIFGLLISSVLSAQLINEGFDDITTLPGNGWSQINVSETVGLSNWFQGDDTTFPSNSGAVGAYIGANFNNTTGANTISNWLITPVVTVTNGDAITFYTRKPDTDNFADRLQVRLSDTGGSSVDPTNSTDLGSYTELLLDINPTLVLGVYPVTWTQQTINISGLTGATDVRIAFRYFVDNGGPAGANSQYIGIDDVVVTSTLGANDFVKNQLNHFYNKDTDVLKLESSNLLMDAVNIYNLLGQNVLNKSLFNFSENLSLSSLNDGMYIVKVTARDSEKTIKLLKQ